MTLLTYLSNSPLGRLIDDVYQTKRIRSALSHLTPEEFAA